MSRLNSLWARGIRSRSSGVEQAFSLDSVASSCDIAEAV